MSTYYLFGKRALTFLAFAVQLLNVVYSWFKVSKLIVKYLETGFNYGSLF